MPHPAKGSLQVAGTVNHDFKYIKKGQAVLPIYKLIIHPAHKASATTAILQIFKIVKP